MAGTTPKIARQVVIGPPAGRLPLTIAFPPALVTALHPLLKAEAHR